MNNTMASTVDKALNVSLINLTKTHTHIYNIKWNLKHKHKKNPFYYSLPLIFNFTLSFLYFKVNNVTFTSSLQFFLTLNIFYNYFITNL